MRDETVFVTVVTALLFLATATVYTPILGGELVFDGRSQLLFDQYMHDIGNLKNILSLRVLEQDILDRNRPINLLSLMLDSQIWARNPFGFHLTSVLLHAACVALLFLLLRQIQREVRHDRESRSRWSVLPPVFGTALFAVHPINSEAVCEVGFREDLLVNFFVLLSLLWVCWLKSGQKPKRVLGVVVACFCLFLATGSKESGLIGPFMLLAYWWFCRFPKPRKYWISLLVTSVILTAGWVCAVGLLAPAESKIFLFKPGYLGGSFWHMLTVEPRILVA